MVRMMILAALAASLAAAGCGGSKIAGALAQNLVSLKRGGATESPADGRYGLDMRGSSASPVNDPPPLPGAVHD